MKTLYVSDLDGTLLRSDESLSSFTCDTVNALVEKGKLFSYATARSFVTASKVTKELTARLPAIVYNGAMIVDSVTGRRLHSNFFGSDVYALLKDMTGNNLFPIVYAFVDGVECFSFIPSRCTRGMEVFLNTRQGDPRTRRVGSVEELIRGEIFYLTFIDESEKLKPFYEKYGQQYHAVYEKDFYSGEQWLEFMPLNASKANAILQLKHLYGCERIVAFGDGKNDLDMFRLADECYAVENAVDELKQLATGLIPANDLDGVARWLSENV